MRWKIFAVLAALSCSVHAKAPDIVLVTLDTFRADRLAAYGGPKDLAPNLNALAARGAVFTDCFVPAPVTLVSHATLMTGTFPARTGLHDNGVGTLAPSAVTLAQALQSRGYETHALVASSVLAARYGLSRGFAVYDDLVGPAGVRLGERMTDAALEVLRQRTAKPLFLWVHYYDTHEPYTVTEAYMGLAKKSPYDASVAYLDAQVGRLLKALPADAIVAVVSDHGESLEDHGELTHGIFLFQTTMKPACLLAGPGTGGPRRVETPCSLADMAPTLLKLAGGTGLALQPQGQDLLSLGSEPRTFPLETWLPFTQFRWLPLVGVTDGRYKWIRGRADRLYDLASDPAELKDVAAAAPREALALKASLPTLPESSPIEGQVDDSLRGLGYAPIPGGTVNPRSLPDPADKTEIIKLMARGRYLRASGDAAQAERFFKEAAEKDPGNPGAWFEYGETLRRNGKTKEALVALDKALSISPLLSWAWLSKGHTLALLDRKPEALSCYERAAALSPDSVDALNPLAASYLDINKPEKALPILERVINSGAANTNTYMLRGRVRLVQNRPDEAAQDFDAALRLSDKPQETLKEAADAYMVQKHFESGLRLYNQGISRYPAFAPNYLTLGSFYLQTEQPQKAYVLFKKALNCPLDAAEKERVEGIVKDLEEALRNPDVDQP